MGKMKKDELILKGKGLDFSFLLSSDGVRVFVWFAAIIGVIALFFTIIFAFINVWLVPIPFLIWSFTVYKTLIFLLKMAKNKSGWAFFLNTHYLFRYFEHQMALTGDKTRGITKIEAGSLVQPILTPGDVITEARQDNLIAMTERSGK